MTNNKNQIETQLDKWFELIEVNKILKYVSYAAITIGSIWVLGKASKLLACATRDFRDFKNAINGK